MSLKFVRPIILSISVFFAIPLIVSAGEPTDRIKIVSDKLIAIITDNTLKSPEMKDKREKMIMETVDTVFNWEEFSRRALAKNWSRRTDQEKKDFASLFGQLVERSYMDKTSQYSGDSVLFLDEKIDGEYGSVNTKLITSAGTETPVEYRMINKNGTWWVYDVYIEGISLVNNYRSQFNSILANSSYEDLVNRLKEKLEKGE